ncbi:MAG: nucleotidyltransferase domain-containing protein [Candidatus Bathyarchaeia archaeon]
MERDDVLKIVRGYLEDLGRRIDVAEAYIFGSTARGDRLRSSDVDILVVSPSVEDMRPDDRIKLAYSVWKHTLSADIFILTPAEFHYLKDRSVVLRDASKYWIKIV